MRCPTLRKLPLPPVDKTGWPWTEESAQLPDAMPDGSPWPKISIVTPSFNQGQFIEETIRSVLLQGYPDMEYIIIDGGSKDDSMDIIKKYEQWLAYWISESDRGQTEAINKGFRKATGRIYAFINSDDYYEINAFKTVAQKYHDNMDIHLVVGECNCFDRHGTSDIFKPRWPDNASHFLKPFSSTFAQPAAFWTSHIYREVDGFDESFNYCFDQEFYMKLALHCVTPKIINSCLAYFRNHDNSKSMSQKVIFYVETKQLINKHAHEFNLSNNIKKKMLKKIDGEVEYFNVFKTWKRRGSFFGFIAFLYLIARYPNKIFERHVLGLLRRLVFNKITDVDGYANY
jgi:glycosyltransferase involved in cell wall biosynthesis